MFVSLPRTFVRGYYLPSLTGLCRGAVCGATGEPRAEISEDSLPRRCCVSTGMGSPSASPSALLGASAKQGRLSTARDRPSDARAPLGMTERERVALQCG